MMKNITAKFQELFGAEANLFQAPGRINLIGEHTDYNNGFVLPAAIDKKMEIALKGNGLPLIRAFSVDFRQYVEIPLSAERAPVSWGNYLLGAASELALMGAEVGGFDCVFSGNIPTGAGLSSSAALTCSVAFGLNEMGNFGFSLPQLARACQMAEHHYAGVKCGIMDQFISLHGKKDQVLRLDCRNLEFEYVSFPHEKTSLFLLDTGVKHELASSEYNTRRRECEDGATILRGKYPQVESLRDATPQMVAECKNAMPEKVFARCFYVTEENQRVLDFCRALQRENMETAGELMNLTHEGLSNLYEVSCPEADFLARESRKMNAVYGSRMMGGGFGGCVLVMTRKETLPEHFHDLQAQYEERFGKKPELIEVNISEGAGRIA